MFTMTRAFPRILCLLALCLAAAGCARPSMTVNALAGRPDGAADRASYVILPGAADIPANDLLFAEYRGHVARLLQETGFAVAGSPAEAGAAVFLSYATREMAAYPGPGPTVGVGVGSGGYSDRDWDGWGGGRFFGLGIGIPVGGGRVVTRYRHSVTLDAKTFTPGAAVPDSGTGLWKVTLTVDNDADILRLIMPAMLEAAKPYINTDSHGPVTVAFEE